jgi:hypothetical protein
MPRIAPGLLFSALTVLLLVVVISTLLFALRRTSALVDSYRARKPLSEPEQALYWRLREAMPECIVLCQVSFSRFLEAYSPLGKAQRSLFNRIAQKSVDFLVCLPDFTIIAAVELDDGSHKRERDVRRDSIFASAKLPLVRLHVRELPAVAELRALFTK